MSFAPPLLQSDLPGVPRVRQGKVRDLYDVGEHLLLVASDRISAFDYVLGSGIPDKGRVLTQLSAFWFARTAHIVPNHVVSTDVEQYPAVLTPFREQLRGRSMLVRKTTPLPVECVARGYISGSGWKDYVATGEVCGVRLPAGLRESDRLPEPLFTPATKADTGHDMNIPEAEAAAVVGAERLQELKRLTMALYAFGVAHAESCGIILADTKFEFGRAGADPRGPIVLADEVLTPDSSRFWPAALWQPGRAGGQPSFDKQFVRDWLGSPASGWDRAGDSPPPPLPDEVVARTRELYVTAFERLTGRAWQG